jgi:hypothetical protein
VNEVAREHCPDESEKRALTLPKSSNIKEGIEHLSEPWSAGRLFVTVKLYFNRDRRSTSRFKIFSSSQKVNTYPNVFTLKL